MTTSQRRRIIEAVADCSRFISTEESRSAHLRPMEIEKLLEWYRSHRAKLLTMLEA